MTVLLLSVLFGNPVTDGVSDAANRIASIVIKRSPLEDREKGILLASLIKPGMSFNHMKLVLDGDQYAVIGTGFCGRTYIYVKYGIQITIAGDEVMQVSIN